MRKSSYTWQTIIIINIIVWRVRGQGGHTKYILQVITWFEIVHTSSKMLSLSINFYNSDVYQITLGTTLYSWISTSNKCWYLTCAEIVNLIACIADFCRFQRNGRSAGCMGKTSTDRYTCQWLPSTYRYIY